MKIEFQLINMSDHLKEMLQEQISLDRIITSIGTAIPAGKRMESIKKYRIGDLFNNIELIEDKIIFDVKEITNRYYKDTIVHILRFARDNGSDSNYIRHKDGQCNQSLPDDNFYFCKISEDGQFVNLNGDKKYSFAEMLEIVNRMKIHQENDIDSVPFIPEKLPNLIDFKINLVELL